MNRKLKITAAPLLSSGSGVVSRAANWRQASGPASMASSSIDSRQKGGSGMRLARFRLLFVTAALGVAGLAILVSGPGASGVRQDQAKLSPQAALDWNVIAVNTVRSATLTPPKFQPEGYLYMAYVQAAEYNAVMAISGRYAPYRSSLQAIRGAAPRAAVAAAAYTTLSYYFPTLAPSLVATYNDYLNVTLAQVPEKARLAGVAVGSAAASQLIVSRFGDGRDAPVSTAFGVAPQPPGTWVFAPPPSLQSAQTPWLANVKPFMLDTPDQFRAPAPPLITSPEYATDLNETEKMGSATSTARTAAQTATALFWNANVINQYNQVFRDVATSHNFDLVDTIRLMAMGNMVAADAHIACMDSKYHYLYWRPVTAIRGASLDGNAATTADPAWSPLLTTPNHPEYPSQHGCVTAAVTGVLTSVLKTSAINIDVPGATGGGTTLTTSQHFATAQDLLQNVANARVWAGLHYRFSTTAGVNIGTQVAQYDLTGNFQPTKK
jgi:VCPO second helical-bundle domain